MKASKSRRAKSKLPGDRRGRQAGELNQATVGDEFEREGMGIAPKE